MAVSDLGFHFRGTFCPSQQFSRGHSSFLGDTLFFSGEFFQPGRLKVSPCCFGFWFDKRGLQCAHASKSIY